MKRFTDLFISRPVLSIAVSVLILILGLRAVGTLPVQQFPQTENATIMITTTYPGAAPDVVAGFITTPLENAVAQVNGIDYMSSTSQTSTSTITLNLVLNQDPDKALTEVSAKANSVLNQLPSGAEQPVLVLQVGQTLDRGAYAGLARQNTVAQPFTYRAVAPGLFQAILSREAAPGPGPADGRGGSDVSPRSEKSNAG